MDELCWSNDFVKPPENNHEALEYFCQVHNPFYDKSCLNEMSKMDKRGNQRQNFEQMRGIYYEISTIYSRSPSFYVIEKREGKQSDRQSSPISYFYILERKVFQAPTLFDVLTVKLNNVVTSMQPLCEKSETTQIGIKKEYVYFYPNDLQNTFEQLVSNLEKQTTREIMDSMERQ